MQSSGYFTAALRIPPYFAALGDRPSGSSRGLSRPYLQALDLPRLLSREGFCCAVVVLVTVCLTLLVLLAIFCKHTSTLNTQTTLTTLTIA